MLWTTDLLRQQMGLGTSGDETWNHAEGTHMGDWTSGRRFAPCRSISGRLRGSAGYRIMTPTWAFGARTGVIPGMICSQCQT